ncbi:MAG: 4Fe-4S binding protein [Syntrophomonadaceae bacterium]|nr:4Fe-4S binding protein [Syntrophomonadaceae bacterium]
MCSYEVAREEARRAIFNLFPELCKGCGLCKEKCPEDALVWSERLGVYGTPTVFLKDSEACTGCGICQTVCPDCAILIERKRKIKKDEQDKTEKKPEPH